MKRISGYVLMCVLLGDAAGDACPTQSGATEDQLEADLHLHEMFQYETNIRYQRLYKPLESQEVDFFQHFRLRNRSGKSIHQFRY